MALRTRMDAFDEPTQATAVDGEVVLMGPDGIAISITPDAAEQSARNMVEAARQARLQTSSSGDGGPKLA